VSEGWPTPEQAALESMPVKITHVVESVLDRDGGRAWVLLAVEVQGDRLLPRRKRGRTAPGRQLGTAEQLRGRFTDGSIESLRAHPPGLPPFTD